MDGTDNSLDENADISIDIEDDDLAEEMENSGITDENELYDNSEQIFEKHKGSVFVVNLDPKEGHLAVSGGEDDMGYVWDILSGDIYMECTGHKDSVTCAVFNHDGSMVATGDMSGVIKVWKIESKQEIWEFETADLEWLLWHPAANVLFAGTNDGDVWMWKIPSGECKTLPSPGCACTSGKILLDGKTAAFGYFDGSIKLVDLKLMQAVHTITKGRDAHTESINQLDVDKEGKVIATASQDGCSKIVNIATGKISASFKAPFRRATQEGEQLDRSVECVGFSCSFNLLAAASLDCFLYIWDLRTGEIGHKFPHPAGLTKLAWDRSGSVVFTSCLDGVCRAWNARSGELVSTFLGAEDEIYDIAISADGKHLLSASADGSVRVYIATT